MKHFFNFLKLNKSQIGYIFLSFLISATITILLIYLFSLVI